jgi:flagellar biosynthesis chaperone FliJ
MNEFPLFVFVIILLSIIFCMAFLGDKLIDGAREERDEARLELSRARRSYEERIAKLKGIK